MFKGSKEKENVGQGFSLALGLRWFVVCRDENVCSPEILNYYIKKVQ